ncbi:MAG: cytochrome C [Burkholderiales bacterium]|nr:MAG: cytochrome C [Burkholderiales bacterium]
MTGGARSAAAAVLALTAAASVPAGAQGEDFAARFAACLACHGENGRSTTALVPSLGGQPAFFAMTQLFLLRDGRRGEPVMIEQARSMTNDDLRAFSAAIAGLPPPEPPAQAPDADRFERGRALATRHRCGVCHNPDFSGREQMPRLANQREDYLLKSMREFASGRRIGYGAAMTQELAGLADEALADLAHFLAHFPDRRRIPQ